ncbi:polysaccharide biosynthesis protein [Bacillus velezensis]|uniref:putative polysaccharide biosynthesis protein n=1 Tax=Bacillus TaxID=1386 RepID=UPI0011B5724A|nr:MULTISPECIES: polysaccharide biosynthesis protein [Bacillus amyloliquefaciens group]QGJ63390.1 polysaccharide biosynthesis protein [Bacillus velezensis]
MNDSVGAKRQSAWKGAFVLVVAGIVTKILSAVYRVPFQNIVGDVGFYIYQQVYPFLGIAVMLSTSGFPVIISKLMNDYSGHKQKIMKISALYVTAAGLVLFALMYAGAAPLAGFMGDARLVMLIRVAAFAFILFPFTAVIRGYFQGVHDMMPSALSQITEQFLRVAVLLGLSFWLLKSGRSLYAAGAGAVSGSIAGSFAALCVLAVFWYKREETKKDGGHIKTAVIVKKLLLYSVTICISSVLMLLIQLVDALNLYSLLSDGTESHAAKQLKGIYDRGQPLLQLGTVFAVSIAASLVPSISKAVHGNKPFIIKEKATSAVKLCLAVGIGASAGLFCILEPVNIMLFQNSEGTQTLQIFSLSIFFASIALTAAAILQGAGHTVFPAVSVLAGGALKWVLNVWLVPGWGITGAALATVLAFAAVACLNLRRIWSKGWLTNIGGVIVRLCWCSLLMVFFLLVYMKLWQLFVPVSRVGAVGESLSASIIGGLLFIYCMIRMKIFTDEELSGLPFGSALSKLKKRREKHGR